MFFSTLLEGCFRDGVHTIDPSDLMRRMVKERLLTFEGKPLFPERRATTVDYQLSAGEMALFDEVTAYLGELLPPGPARRRPDQTAARGPSHQHLLRLEEVDHIGARAR